MKALILLLTTLSLSLISTAQQDIQVSNFDYFSSFYNPASITQTKHICGNMLGRNQWSGLAGRPNTGFINTSYNFSDVLWGNVIFTKDVIGLQDNTILKFGLAKSFQLATDVKLSFGLNLNYSRFGLSSNFITPDTPVWADDLIPDYDVSSSNFDMDAGLFIQARNISIGLSSTQITEPTMTNTSFTYQSKRHYFVLAGYNHTTHYGDFENFFLAKSDVTSTQLDFKSNFWHDQGWMVGLAYRVSDAIVPMIGYQDQFGRVRLRGVYSYDVTTSKLNNYSAGSHEICLKICIAPLEHTERYTHPRHLGTWK